MGLKDAGVTQIPDPGILSAGPVQLRDRLDFVFEEGRFGLFSKGSQQIEDLKECYLLSPELQNFFADFRRIRWPIAKGSFRLRIGPQGERGAWLDFANLDVRDLIDEQKQLRRLQDLCFVEIGQRRKVLKANDKKMFLSDPELREWSRTLYLGQSVALFSCVGSFSQTGRKANELIVQRISEMGKMINPQRILEYGAGNGNLSFPIMNEKSEITVVETDELSLQGLNKAAEILSLSQRLRILDLKREKISFTDFDLILANPPRSGIPEFLQKLSPEKKRPKHFIYMSCFSQSFFKDARVMVQLGYQLQQIDILDQFPQSPHYEIISNWRINP